MAQTAADRNKAKLAQARAGAATRISTQPNPVRTVSAPAAPRIGGQPSTPFERRGGTQPVAQPIQPVQPATQSASDQAILAQQKAMYDARTATLGKPKITAPAMVKTETAPVTNPNIGNYDPLDYSIARKIVEKQYKDSGFTPEELDNITSKYLGKSQTDAYAQQEASTNALIKTQRDQVAAEEKRIAQEEKRLASERQNKTGTFASTLETKYDPMRTRAREQASRTASIQDRMFGASGLTGSKVAEYGLADIEVALTENINAIEAAKAAEIMLYEAQLAGADGETISAMRQNVEAKRAQADQFELESKAALEERKMQAAIDGDARSMEMLEKYTEMFTTNSLKKVDEKVTNLIGDGFVYDEYGRRVTDGDGNDMTVDLTNALMGDPSNVQYVGAQYDTFGNQLQPAGYFDKKSRQFITLGGGSSGGIPVEGGSTGFTGSGMSPITNYTAITSGSSVPVGQRSPENPNGLDLAGAKGTPIKTPVNGKVVSAGNVSGWGNSVVIEDQDGVYHRFSHLDSINVSPGMQVNAGTMLGGMGNTGNVIKMGAGGTGTHLDYTVYNNANDFKAKRSQPVNVAEMYAGIQSTSGVIPREQRAQVAADKGLTSDEITTFLKTGILPKAKPVSGDAAKLASIAKTAIENDMNQLAKEIAKLPATGIKGKAAFELNPRINSLVSSLSDKVGRLRSGGAVNTEEEKRFKQQFNITVRDMASGEDPRKLLFERLRNTYDEFSSVLSGLEQDVPAYSPPSLTSTVGKKTPAKATFSGKTRNDAIRFLKANGYSATTANIDALLNSK